MRNTNLWIGNGRLGRDPELRHTQSGKAVCSVSMACQFDDNKEWVNLVFWDKLAETVERYCKKGSFIEVMGRLQTRSWEKDGVTRDRTEVVANSMLMLDTKTDRQEQGVGNSKEIQEDDSDIPF